MSYSIPRSFVAALLAAAISAPVSAGAPPPPAPPPLQILSPGFVGFVVEPLPINVVFVGYEEGTGPRDVDPASLLAGQSDVSAAFARIPLFFGRLLPTHTATLPDYRLSFADEKFEDQFFGFLASIAQAAPLTIFQRWYNDESVHSLTIDESFVIDAPAVERWLADHAGPLLGIDTSAPTVFFIDWFGRSDFRFHVYGKIGEPDTDTGFDFGLFDSRKLIAWGGSPADPGEPVHRVWFHDLSAGPEFNTDNWDLTTADLDGDGILDYRMPPTWEYGNTDGYRPFTDLSGDLGKILRYVVLDLLISPSPLYPPTISPPRLPSEISIDVTRFSAPSVTPATINAAVLTGGLEALQPWNTFTLNDDDQNRFAGRIAAVHRCWVTGWLDPAGVGETCYGNNVGRLAFLDLTNYLIDHLMQFTSRDSDHSIPTLLFEIPESETNPFFRAEADFDPRDGSQLHIVSYETPTLRSFGFGQTDTLVHEVGHHLGLSHVHDGIDYASGIEFGASGDFYFAWLGDESSTVMSYLGNENDFSQFDRDHMGRWLTAAYLNQSNQVLARLFSSRRAPGAYAAVSAADADALAALQAYANRNYIGAAFAAKQGYDRLLRAADDINVPIEPQARAADMKSQSPGRFFVDPIPPLGSEHPAPAGPAMRDVPRPELPDFGDPTRVIWVAPE